jgi:hypothetical protein
MIKFCPIMSFQKQYNDEERCMDEACAFWDEERGQCCIKTMALAVAGKKDGGSSPTAQTYYIPPSSYCSTNAVSKVEPKPFRENPDCIIRY